MSEFSVYTLSSGSKGNCIYIKLGEDELLIDAGTSCKRIGCALNSIGTSLAKIKAIFITHEHSDHVAALEVISKKYSIPIHMTEPSAAAYFTSPKTEHAHAACILHPPHYSVRVGGLTVGSFVTPHDSAGSVGYIVSDGTAEHTAAVATDIGHITDEISDALLGVENIILESNHDENMLLCGTYPYELKRRILSDRGHLSNDAASAFICRLAAAGTKHILLAHLSEENNLPELAYRSALDALAGECAGKVTISVAGAAEVTRLV